MLMLPGRVRIPCFFVMMSRKLLQDYCANAGIGLSIPANIKTQELVKHIHTESNRIYRTMNSKTKLLCIDIGNYRSPRFAQFCVRNPGHRNNKDFGSQQNQVI